MMILLIETFATKEEKKTLVGQQHGSVGNWVTSVQWALELTQGLEKTDFDKLSSSTCDTHTK